MSGSPETDAAEARLRALEPLNVMSHPPVTEGPTGSGSLDGTSVLVKANIAIAGQIWDGASLALSDILADADAGAVARLRSAGASVIGHANCHELAFGITSANAHHGPVKSPRDPLRMAGGSSGGSAAAVAARAVPAALGTDTGGSGRIPAIFCGCVGFRPTTGRYPSDGVLTLSTSFDTVTPFAPSVPEIVVLDAVLSGDTRSAERGSLAGARLGLLRDPLWVNTSHAMRQATRNALAALERDGATLVEATAPDDGIDIAAECSAIALPLVLAETERFWTPFLQERLGLSIDAFVERIASPDVAGVFGMIAQGHAPPSALLGDLQARRHRVAATLNALMDDHRLDALVHPATAITAPRLDETARVTVDGQEHDLFPLLTDARLVASVAAMPALALPAGLDHDGLPFGIEFLGRNGADRALLALGAAAEAVWGPLPPPAAS